MAFEPAEKKDSKGPEKKGWQRDVPLREVVLEGQTRGRWSITGEHEGRGERERCPSPRRSKRRKDRRERSRALSCRPGSQIRRGLKSGVDCV